MENTTFGPNDKRYDDFLADLQPSEEALLASYQADFPALGIARTDDGLGTGDGRRLFVLMFSLVATTPLAMNFRLSHASPGFAGTTIETQALGSGPGWDQLAWTLTRAAMTENADGDLGLPEEEWDLLAVTRGESSPARIVSVAIVEGRPGA